MSAWLGMFFLSASWVYFLSVYTPCRMIRGLILIALGVLFLFYSLPPGIHSKCRPWHYLLLLPFIPALVIIPFPYSLGIILLFAGWLLLLSGGRLSAVRKTGNAVIFSGLIVSVQAAAAPFLHRLGSRLHEFSSLAHLLNFSLRALGFSAVELNQQVLVQTYERCWPLPVTWDALAFHELAIFFLAAWVLLAFSQKMRERKNIFLCLAVFLLFALLRLAFIQLLFLNFSRHDFFWHKDLKFVTLLPLAFLLAKLIPVDLKKGGFDFFPRDKLKKEILCLAGLAFIAGFGLVGVFAFSDPGVRKQGRILIDEGHSDWEWTTMPFDTLWYSERACYNYYCLVQHLNHFYSVTSGFEEITPELLENYDILVLKTPTEPYRENEKEAIVEFVREGGGLYLIGDHTNTFGISAHLNPVAREFGFRFEYDATYDLPTGHLSLYQIPELLPHPAVQHIPIFLFGTSCSLSASLFAEDMITGYGLKALYLDYAGENFFPEDHSAPPEKFGLFLQQCGGCSGRGRYLAFSDSTVYSNFWVFMPGKAELLLGSVEWLNRKNFLSWLKPVLFILALLAVLFGGYFWRAAPVKENLLVLSSAAVLGLVLGLGVFSVLNTRGYSLPEPHTPFTEIIFEKEHCDFGLPITTIMDIVPDNYFHTFYTWIQRLGYVPHVGETLSGSLRDNRMVILVNPVKEFSGAGMEMIKNYLEAGGIVLLLDSARNADSTANQFLGEFGMKLDPAVKEAQPFFDLSGEEIGATRRGQRVVGGEAKLLFADQSALLGIKKVGKGTLAVFADSVLFTDSSLGTTVMLPSLDQRRIYDVQFWLLSNLIEGDLSSENWLKVLRTASSEEALAVPPSGERPLPGKLISY